MEEIKSAIDALGRTFEEFKQANDLRLKEMEKGKQDVVLAEKVDRVIDGLDKLEDIKAKLEEIEKKANRPEGFETKEGKQKVQDEYKEAFLREFVCKGRDNEALRSLEAKAVNVTTAGDGGYAVPEILDRAIIKRMAEVTPMRRLASQITVSTPDYKVLADVGGITSGWVDENDARSETNSATLQEITAVMGEIYGAPRATQTALDDLFFDVEGWLVNGLADKFTLEEAIAFVTGDGSKKPKGFLGYTTAAVADGSRTFGVIEHVATGTSGGFGNDDVVAVDKFIDLQTKMKTQHLPGCVWAMNRRTAGTVRKFKDGDDKYIWQPGMQAGEAPQLLGHPVEKLDAMPNIGANSLSVAFANFKRGYLIVDRIGFRLLRDPYTAKPYVEFYATKRVGGMIVDDEAIKVLKFATS